MAFESAAFLPGSAPATVLPSLDLPRGRIVDRPCMGAESLTEGQGEISSDPDGIWYPVSPSSSSWPRVLPQL